MRERRTQSAFHARRNVHAAAILVNHLASTTSASSPPIVKAIQALGQELTALEATVARFAQNLATHTLVADNATFGQVTSQQDDTQKLCLAKSDGTPVCVTGDQLSTLLSQSATPGGEGAVGSSTGSSVSAQASSSTSATFPAGGRTTIEIAGDNPAIIHVGDSRADLGATAVVCAGHDLGLRYFLNGKLVSNIVVDTSSVATDTIDYVATDSYGNTASSTRTVLIEAAAGTPTAASTISSLNTASTTEASSTAQ